LNRCDTCPGNTRFIPGDGPDDADVLCVGEAPGKEEDKTGIPFIGKAGREFNENYLPLAGLKRPNVYVTNVRKCRPEQNRTPTDKEARSCATAYLSDELERVQPTYLILMGATACKLLPDPLDLETQHGIPLPSSVFDWTGWVIPMYHPAAGLHTTAMMQPILEDWANLRQWFETGVWQWAMDEYETHDYRHCKSMNQVDEYFEQYSPMEIIGGDTESHGIEDWSIQTSTAPGTGIMILEKDKATMDRLGLWLYKHIVLWGSDPLGSELALHNAPVDLRQFERIIGCPFPYRDTMQEAYHLGNLPQGLKPLAYRLLGVRMTSWKETVQGASRDALCAWIVQASMEAQEKLTVIKKRFHKTTGKPLQDGVTKSLEEKKLDHLLTYAIKNDDYDVWSRIDEYRDEWNLLFDKEIGEIPVLGIGNMTLENAKNYAVLDADVELRVALALKTQRRYTSANIWGVSEDDMDPLYTPEMAG